MRNSHSCFSLLLLSLEADFAWRLVAALADWAVVVVLVVLCLTALDWFIYARTRFAPPVEEDWIRALSS